MSEPKTSPKSGKVVALVVVIAILSLGFIVGGFALANRHPNKDLVSDAACSKYNRTNYTITVQGNKATPDHIEALQCDTLTIRNQDNQNRLMAFGKHEAHTPYDGVEERSLNKDDSFTVNLVQVGDFLVHDHEDDVVQATFVVKPRP